MLRSLFLLPLAGCIGGSGMPNNQPVTDFEGTTFEVQSGFAYSSGGFVLSNMEDTCASMTWWLQRDGELSDMFFEDYTSSRFESALANTEGDWIERMSTEVVWALWVDYDVPSGEDLTLEAATENNEGSSVFYGEAEAFRWPVLTVRDDGASLGSDVGHIADTISGTLAVDVGADTAAGTIETRLQTFELAEYDIDLAFDLVGCPEWEAALNAR